MYIYIYIIYGQCHKNFALKISPYRFGVQSFFIFALSPSHCCCHLFFAFVFSPSGIPPPPPSIHFEKPARVDASGMSKTVMEPWNSITRGQGHVAGTALPVAIVVSGVWRLVCRCCCCIVFFTRNFGHGVVLSFLRHFEKRYFHPLVAPPRTNL